MAHLQALTAAKGRFILDIHPRVAEVLGLLGADAAGFAAFIIVSLVNIGYNHLKYWFHNIITNNHVNYGYIIIYNICLVIPSGND